MIPLAPNIRVWLVTGHTDMRKGMNSLALLVQEKFSRDAHAGDLFVFRARGDKIKATGSMALACRFISSG